uniref:Uncharacterized protein n=1 Tax=mine drainage metagenome TaxID=410659 RepID=E6Q0T9_9ZZZZ
MRAYFAVIAAVMLLAMPTSAQAQGKRPTLTWDGKEIIYGIPAQVAAIRAVLTPICTGGMHLTGLGPGFADELIQVSNYAIAEGSCGNPELHLILHRKDGTWQRLDPCPPPRNGIPDYACLATNRCAIGGGATGDYGPGGIYDILSNRCFIPIPIVNRIIAIRSREPWLKQMDQAGIFESRKCRYDPQRSTECPGYIFSGEQKRHIADARDVRMLEIAASVGDFTNALIFANKIVARERHIAHYWDSEVAIVRNIAMQVESGKITRAQAKAEYQHFVQTGQVS